MDIYRNQYEKLIKHLPEKGIFFEAGANDGIWQSYTYNLEIEKGWSGVLVEPSLPVFQSCLNNRPASKCLNFALVEDPSIKSVFGDFDGNMMSSVSGNRLGREATVSVDATTLTKIFDENFSDVTVDLMSIDVEHYELNVLRGMDFERHRPKFILLEVTTSNMGEIVILLNAAGYIMVDNISGYTHTNNPQWDGTHNDYLFKSIE